MNEQNLTKRELLKVMKNMDISEYRKRAMDIHNKWINEPPTDQEKNKCSKI